MSRSKWKIPFLETSLLKTSQTNFFITSSSRNSTIVHSFASKNFKVHNGLLFFPVQISNLMVGRKLGEFSLTRKIHKYKKKK